MIFAHSLVILCLFQTSLGNSVNQILRPVKVSEAKLIKSEVTATQVAFSATVCAVRATQETWSYLMWHKNGICYISDMKLTSDYNDNTTDAIQSYTKLHWHCVIGNIIYNHGAFYFGIPPCILKKCWIRKVVDFYKGVQMVCNSGFSAIPGIGCIQSIFSPTDYYNATDYCRGLDSQLIVPENFYIFREYLGCRKLYAEKTGDYWVGMKDGKWTDGKLAITGNWASNTTNSTTHCGYASELAGYLLADSDCYSSKNFTCQQI